MRKIFATILATMAMSLSAPAMAETIWLNHGGYTNVNGGKQFSNGDVTVRVTGWSLIGGGNAAKGSVGVYSEGLGVSNGVQGDSHTVDNGGSKDFLIFQFDKAVQLDNAWFRTGWHSMNDTDATIGYATSLLSINTDLPLAGLSQADLAPLNLFGSNAPDGNSFRNVNPGGNIGNVWLIGASFANMDHRLDGFKLKKLTYSQPPAVPEPGTWLMMILGFGLIGAIMRRRETAGGLVRA